MKLDYDIELNILEDIHELGRNQCFVFSDEEGSDNYLKTSKIREEFYETRNNYSNNYFNFNNYSNNNN